MLTSSSLSLWLARPSTAESRDAVLPTLHELLDGYPEWESSGRTKKQGYVTRVDAACLSYDSFFADYMMCNEPVVVGGVTAQWRASTEWVKTTSTGKEAVDAKLLTHLTPNMEFLVKQFGSSNVQVQVPVQYDGVKKKRKERCCHLPHCNFRRCQRETPQKRQ
jgi:hypothetical protein